MTLIIKSPLGDTLYKWYIIHDTLMEYIAHKKIKYTRSIAQRNVEKNGMDGIINRIKR